MKYAPLIGSCLGLWAIATIATTSVAYAQSVAPDHVPTPEAAEAGHAIDAPLTEADAVRQALTQAPSIEAATAAIAQAEAQVDAVWASIVPTLVVTARYTRLSAVGNSPLIPAGDGDDPSALVAGVDDPEARALWQASLAQTAALQGQRIPFLRNQFAFEAQLQVPLSELLLVLLPRLHASRAQARVAEAQRTVAQAELSLRTREAYYGVIRARALLAMSEAEVTELEEQLRAVSLALQHGAARNSEQLGISARLAGARARVARAGALSMAAEASLRALLRLPEDAPIRLASVPANESPAVEGAPSIRPWLEEAMASRPEVHVLRRAMTAAGHASDVARGNRWPALRLALGAQLQNPNQRYVPQREQFDTTWDVSLVLAWSPNQAVAASAQARAADAQRAELAANLDAFEQALTHEVATAIADRLAAHASMQEADAAHTAAAEAYRAAQLEHQEGQATLTDVLDAHTLLSRARFAQVEAAASTRLTEARLLRAVGRDASAGGLP